MISPTGTSPILMDLGSLAPSPTPIRTRADALRLQDAAAEHSTLPYRAPELLDVRVDASSAAAPVVDTKVDIWSLGCTVYACLVGKSPFERRSEETGGSLTMCILGGDWRFPDESGVGGVRVGGGGERGGGGRTRTGTGTGTGGGSGIAAAKGKARQGTTGATGAQGQGQGQGQGGTRERTESGGSLLAPPGEELVLSEGVKEVVRRCLRVEPGERPDVDELMGMVEDVIAGLPRDPDEVDDADDEDDEAGSAVDGGRAEEGRYG